MSRYAPARLMVTLLALAATIACAAISPYARLYSEPPLPRDQIAILTHRDPYMRTVQIQNVDDTAIDSPSLVELKPGHHTVCLGFVDTAGSGVIRSEACQPVALEAQAGHVYQAYGSTHTHRATWVAGTWDVTGDLGCRENARLADQIVSIMNRNRPGSPIELNPPPCPQSLVGLGEKHKAVITGAYGDSVELIYDFDRYRPFLLVNGADGQKYHIEMSRETGAVIHVFGRRVTARGVWSFQPLGSEYAVWFNEKHEVGVVYREGPRGVYTEVKDLTSIVLPPLP